MKRPSPTTGVKRVCAVVVNGERCQGPVDAAQAQRSLDDCGEVLCRAHQHARNVPKIEAADRAAYAEFKARADAIRAAEAKGFRVTNNRLAARLA